MEPVDDYLTNKKGFLKEKGYRPESKIEHKLGDQKPKHAQVETEEELSYDYSITKQPRPEPKTKEIKTGRFKRKTPAEVLISQWSKDPRIRRSYSIRYSIVVIAIIILLLSTIVSYQNNLSQTGQQPSLEKNGYTLMMGLLDYQNLKVVCDNGARAWDVNKFLILTSDEIINDLQPGFEFLIEVYDLSNYSIRYNRTLENNLAWSTVKLSNLFSTRVTGNKDVFEISNFVNIFISTEEVHLARIDITVWK